MLLPVAALLVVLRTFVTSSTMRSSTARRAVLGARSGSTGVTSTENEAGRQDSTAWRR